MVVVVAEEAAEDTKVKLVAAAAAEEVVVVVGTKAVVAAAGTKVVVKVVEVGEAKEEEEEEVADPHGVVVEVATEEVVEVEAVLDAADQDAVTQRRTIPVSIASSPTFSPASLPRPFLFISTRSIAPTRVTR